jgi:hypothetical protein
LIEQAAEMVGLDAEVMKHKNKLKEKA